MKPFMACLASIVIASAATFTAVAADTGVMLAKRNDATAAYVEDLIWLAISKTDYKNGINTYNQRVNAPEWRDALQDGHVDAIWSVSTPEIEQRFRRIPIDIYFGYMGYRICVSNIDKKPMLENVSDLDGLHGIVFGSGAGWSDTDKLRSAGMIVIEGNIDSLVKMAVNKEIDCFARGAFEPWDEQIRYLQRGITNLNINETFVIRYPNPFYIYVNKDDKETYHLLSKGLTAALADGSLVETFKKTKQFMQFKKYANLDNRIKIELPINPILLK